MPIQIKISVFTLWLLVLSSCSHSELVQSFVVVYKYDNSVQCKNGGVELDVMAQELTNSGIDIICSKKDHDAMLRITTCGMATGAINTYKIYIPDFSDAEKLGFLDVNNLSGYQYNNKKCE